MFRTCTIGKKGIAACLLGLFLFILAEKSTHDHSVLPEKEFSGESRVKAAAVCAVCEFQLHAGADLPVPAQTAFIFYPDLPVFFYSSVAAFKAPVGVHPDRGPPCFQA